MCESYSGVRIVYHVITPWVLNQLLFMSLKDINMKKYLVLFFSFISTLGVSQTYNVNFDQVNWVSSGSGVSLSNDTLSIIGNASEYRTYKYTLDVDPNMPNRYFTARIYLENIQQGTAEWDLPKIRIENTSGNKLINFNHLGFNSPTLGSI